MNFEIYAPGRVNLLGEHTDYNGLPVLPAAIPQTIAIEGKPREENTVTARSVVHDNETVSFPLEAQISPHPQGHWVNYVKAGMQGLTGATPPDELKSLRGCDITIRGTIPRGVGLSSSSALVIASALALLQANQRTYNPLQLAERMAEAEHYVGTRGGGMDQAACLLARPGRVLKIDFFPLRVEAIPFPESASLVICDSRVRAKKSANALQSYNLRALECRFGTMILQRHLERQGVSSRFDRIGSLLNPPWNLTLGDLTALIVEVIREEYSLTDLRNIIHNDERIYSLLRDYQFKDESVYASLCFACGKRLRHVARDAQRVERSKVLLREGDLEAFGDLMNEGHRSAREDFEISCAELDELVQLAQANGALGSRLTGAGFGGCTVNLVRKEHAERFCERMAEEYYSKRDAHSPIEDAIFAIDPSDGARVLLNHGLRV